ncbi:glycosyltransferase family 4 protein [Candidatus Parcubacteria bacterium]|nr:glycosyltransferase family 4 protein [Candidatus Parcubacteria bacterium]
MKNNNKKQIDIVMKYFYPVTAGIEITVMETFSRLASAGWKVRVHTSRDTYLEKNVLSGNENIKGVEIKRYPWSIFGFWPDIDWKKSDMLVLENFNIFPHFQIMAFTWVLKIIKKKNFSLILTPHGGYTPEWRVFGVISRNIKRIYHQTIGACMINKCVDKIHAVSTWEKKEMIPFGISPEKIVVVENGLEDEAYADFEEKVSKEFKRVIKGYGKYILQIGRVHRIKNHKTVIRALAKLPKDINYVITGPIHDDKYKQELDELIKSLELEEQIIFSGIIKGAEKYYLIKNALAMVHMALWECYCGVVLEAMSQGTMCVVSEDSAFPYLYKDKFNGYNLKAKDHKAAANAINNIIEYPDSREHKAIKQRNLDYANNHSWNAMVERLKDFYLNY